VEECGPCSVFASFTLVFDLQLRKKHGKISVRVRKISVRVQYAYYQNTHILQNPHKHTHYKTQKRRNMWVHPISMKKFEFGILSHFPVQYLTLCSLFLHSKLEALLIAWWLVP